MHTLILIVFHDCSVFYFFYVEKTTVYFLKSSRKQILQ